MSQILETRKSDDISVISMIPLILPAHSISGRKVLKKCLFLPKMAVILGVPEHGEEERFTSL